MYLLTFLRHFLQASILVLAIFSISSSQPLLSQISLRKREPQEFETMGQALGIPDSGLLLQREPTQVIDPNEPLDKLLLDKRFRQSFMAFADRCCISAKLQHLGIHLCGKHSYILSVFFFLIMRGKSPGGRICLVKIFREYSLLFDCDVNERERIFECFVF